MNKPILSLMQLQSAFLTLLPKIQTHGRIRFRHLHCQHKKQDAIAEMVALAWHWFLRLAKRGRDARQFPTTLAGFAARAVYSGRKLCGQDKARDVLSSRAQQMKHFAVGPLPQHSSLEGNVFDEALHENTVSPILDQVAFRQDFPAWQHTRTDRDRRLMQDLMVGERTQRVARKHGLSPARVSQLRREFHQDWRSFCEELV
jgi:hypothetical protein